ncbi:heme-binding protein [Gluconacetobacter takamatsuzukensis]|uniref:Heme-binding protein n=1 Tax=Gluconacetobacter takamatsuzukensis TaxID=1286190 RepID=A0A7W4KG69_9PROT|nr:heme-binding protein [Gluconacetobacter takamatsuzukensis]
MLVAGAVAGLPAGSAARAAGPAVITTQKLSWEIADQLAAAAVRICAARGWSVTAAVVDPSGHEQAVIKGDTVPLQSLSVSYRKAYTAYAYGMTFDKDTTSALIAAKVTGPPNGALNTIPQVLFVPGGVLLRRADRSVLGGLGVSGAPGGELDEACAVAAVKEVSPRFQ